ncbi:meiosis-specific kinetochore protein [Pogoniulus pusillus]|uniref:meiosis-specific kinetochore protein n=1 Tax=Pogoniulus pusillus TaxID=488313 RepID=UPI0030B93E08
MERYPWQGVCREATAPLKKRRLSPLPEALGSRAGSSQPCRRQLFRNAGPRSGAEPGRLKRKPNVNTLVKIKENSEITQVIQTYSQSNQVNVQGETDLEIKEDKIEESTVQIQESLLINFESKKSLKSTDVTSSTGMTLPTGVSTFLLECLDTDSTEEYNTGPSTSLRSLPSPEMFRDDGSERSNFDLVDFGKYKNSTLLDSSKAVAIDKFPHISNLSAILEPTVEEFPDQYIRRKKLSHCNYTSSLSVSTIVAGKKVCKITAARERTPNLKTGMRRSSPLGPERKPDNQSAKLKRQISKVKGKQSNTSEEGPSSLQLCGAPGNTSARAVGLAAEALPHERRGSVRPQCGRGELCSIVRMSPPQKLSRLHQIPADTKAFSFPKRLPEDNITSTENWIYCKPR